ncbi:MAG: T9SS type A sorting domain-containing protein [Sporocytophaga sp.]|uniref:T9SS type A sorting domain-containing protein n=1 Tax=Sporocytophaga sp. TaxID=2231183 RepID=UPI001B19E78A|nr:T9SS type A sorting domain-containing protein [Sporocytophaga sp.]MBO9703287.1 T9SS type A sorting domain-containing protein [Sporocytophaga sp.]
MKKSFTLLSTFLIYLITISSSNKVLGQDGTIDESFVASRFNSHVRVIKVLSDKKIIVAGEFTSYNGTTVNRIARLNEDGSLDETFNPGGTGANSTIHAVEIQKDGKILIGGSFFTYNGEGVNRLARLNADGTYDNSFNIGGGFNNTIYAIAIQEDTKIVVGGAFTVFNNGSINRIARLTATGSKDDTFVVTTALNGEPRSIIIQPDQKILASGLFSTYNGAAAQGVVRINVDGSKDNSLNSSTGASSEVWTMALQSDGKIILGGSFTKYKGITKNYLVRINSDGAIDNTFAMGSGADVDIHAVTVQNDGKIIIGGEFNTFNGNLEKYLSRLNADGTDDPTFNIEVGPNLPVFAVTLDADNKILIGGYFLLYSDMEHPHLARLNGSSSPVASVSYTDFNKEFKLFPNPALSNITIELPEFDDLTELKLFSISGTLRKSIVLTNRMSRVDIIDLQEGIYFYEVWQHETKRIEGKLIIN